MHSHLPQLNLLIYLVILLTAVRVVAKWETNDSLLNRKQSIKTNGSFAHNDMLDVQADYIGLSQKDESSMFQELNTIL